MDVISSMPVTAVFIAIFALVQIPMTFLVGIKRLQVDIPLSDGDDRALLQRIRAHGNYTETVPISLLAMAAAELSGAPHMLLWIAGAVLLCARLLHFSTIMTSVTGPGRAIGMLFTFFPMLVFSGYVLLNQFGLIG